MTKPPRELIEFLFRYPAPVQSTALGLRAVVLSEMAPRHEYIFAMRSKVVLLYGPTERVIEDAVCMVSVFARHVNLTFMQGADLDDEAGVLRGSGKRMRYIRVGTVADLDRPEIRAYLRQARQHAGLTRPRKASAEEVLTRVKPARQTTGRGLSKPVR